MDEWMVTNNQIVERACDSIRIVKDFLEWRHLSGFDLDAGLDTCDKAIELMQRLIIRENTDGEDG